MAIAPAAHSIRGKCIRLIEELIPLRAVGPVECIEKQVDIARQASHPHYFAFPGTHQIRHNVRVPFV